jgi:tellurite methyltransferase
VDRAITGFHVDEDGDWVAELSCGHDQHVRHRPPFQLRPWVTGPEGRAERVNTPLDCPLCDRAELPHAVRFARSSPEWNEQTIPAALLRDHRVGRGTWGVVRVHQGKLRCSLSTPSTLDVVLGPDSEQAIPPDVQHHVEPLGPVRCSIDFFTIDRSDAIGDPSKGEADEDRSTRRSPLDEGGDPSCWLGLTCPDCGAVVDGGLHREGCRGASGS